MTERIKYIHRKEYRLNGGSYLKMSTKLLTDSRFDYVHLIIVYNILKNADDFKFTKVMLMNRIDYGRQRFYNAWNDLKAWGFLIKEGTFENFIWYFDELGAQTKPRKGKYIRRATYNEHNPYKMLCLQTLCDCRFHDNHTVIMLSLLSNSDYHKVGKAEIKKKTKIGDPTFTDAWRQLIEWNYITQIGAGRSTKFFIDETGNGWKPKNFNLSKQTSNSLSDKTCVSLSQRSIYYKQYNKKRKIKSIYGFCFAEELYPEMTLNPKFDLIPDNNPIKQILELVWFPHMIYMRKQRVTNLVKCNEFVFLCRVSNFDEKQAGIIVQKCILEYSNTGNNIRFFELKQSEKDEIIRRAY